MDRNLKFLKNLSMIFGIICIVGGSLAILGAGLFITTAYITNDTNVWVRLMGSGVFSIPLFIPFGVLYLKLSRFIRFNKDNWSSRLVYISMFTILISIIASLIQSYGINLKNGGNSFFSGESIIPIVFNFPLYSTIPVLLIYKLRKYKKDTTANRT